MRTSLITMFSILALSASTHAGESKALTEAEAKLQNLAVATFAGGCFWCMEGPFDKFYRWGCGRDSRLGFNPIERSGVNYSNLPGPSRI